MTAERTSMPVYHLFASHSWSDGDSFEKLTGLLHMPTGPLSDFRYQLYSVSKDDQIQNIPSKKPLRAAIEEKMKTCSCILIMSGVYKTHSKWIDIEIEIAKKLRKRIILIDPWRNDKATEVEKKAAHVIVKWKDEDVINAIKK